MRETKTNRDNENSERSREMSAVAFKRLKIGLFLSVAYACNIGGTGALNGTAPNLVLKGVVEQMFGSDTGLNFATWTMFNFPTMLLCVLVGWLWLQLIFIRPCLCKSVASDVERQKVIRQAIRQKYDQLHNFSFQEIVVLVCFIILVALWLVRDPKFIEGWHVYFPNKKVGDATVVMAIIILLFAIPVRFERRAPGDVTVRRKLVPVLEWRALHEKVPWNVIILIGGGFAIADASKSSGLSLWMGKQLSIFRSLPAPAIVIITSLMMAMLTEVASNTATASIFLPVLADMSKAIRVHPLYTMLPAAVACSYAFMLPIATPPNAIVFTSAGMSQTDMVVPGFIMNIVCVLVMTLMINTLGVYMFNLNEFPAWAEGQSVNVTKAILRNITV